MGSSLAPRALAQSIPNFGNCWPQSILLGIPNLLGLRAFVATLAADGCVVSWSGSLARTRSHGERAGAPAFIDPPLYARHRPEATLLYELVERRYREHGFLRVRCEDCHAKKFVAFSCKRRGSVPPAVRDA